MKCHYAYPLLFFGMVSSSVPMENHKENVNSNIDSPQTSKATIRESGKFVNGVIRKSTQLNTNQDEGNKKLVESFDTLKRQVQSCLDNGSVTDIQDVFSEFLSNEVEDENFYQQECMKHDITKWPSQATFREAYFGEILYPSREIDLFYEHSSNAYLLQRFDVLWSLAASSRFNNPLARYYLARGLEIHIHKVATCNTNFTEKIYQKALKTLEAVEGNDAVYLLRATAYRLGHRAGYPFNPQEAFNLYAKSKGKESQLQALLIREAYQVQEEPKREEYLALTESYPKAYVEIANKYSNTFDEKNYLLNLAYEKGYIPALLELGILYNRDPAKALEYYEAYGERGYPEGYLYGAAHYVGRVKFSKSYRKKSNEEIEKGIYILEKAHALHHPEASHGLGILLLEKYRRDSNIAHKEQAIKCFEKAAFLGEMGAYEYIDNSQSPIDHFLNRINEILGFIGYYSEG